MIVLLDITLKNYRCFPDSDPVSLSIRKEFTAFVGSNNSGKSSLLKFFVEFRNLFSTLSGDLPTSLRGRPYAFQFTGVSDLQEVFSNANTRNLVIDLTFLPTPEDDPTLLPITLNSIQVQILRDQNVFQVTQASLPSGSITLSDGLAISSDQSFLTQQGGARLAHVAPVISALRASANSVYLGAFRNAINVGGSTSYYDIHVGEQFIRNWRAFKTGTNKRRADAAYRLTQDIRQIFGFDYLEINTSDDDKSLNLIVNGKHFRLDELGSGLSQFVLVLANLAIRQQDFILIDEPELNLHPSLQIDFLTTLASYATEGVLFGTHSIGLARAIGQQIYSLKRVKEGESRVRLYSDTPRLAEFWANSVFPPIGSSVSTRYYLSKGQQM